MKPEQLKEFGALITDALAFYRRDVTAFTLDVWWQACQPFDMEQVRKALTAHAMDPERGQFAPMPADLVRYLLGTSTDRALLAWGQVYDSMRHSGAYQSIAFEDTAIHAAVLDMGGWPALCATLEQDLPHIQRRFCDLYRAHAARPDVERPVYLVGLAEQGNSTRGIEAQRPTPIPSPSMGRIARAKQPRIAAPETAQ